MTRNITVQASSGNVFADLGLANPDELLVKAELARKISEIITKQHMTQAEAAKLLGIDQPKISALMRGKLSGFSTERLFRFLNALGRDVEIMVKVKPKFHSSAQTRVVAPCYDNNLSQLLLRKLDEWIEAGWQTLQELGLSLQLPQLEHANARSVDELEAEPDLFDLLEDEILAAEKLANNDPNHPLASVRMAKEFYDLGRPLVLAISVSPVNDSDLVNVLLQLHSLGGENLPPAVEMILLDDQGKPELFTDDSDKTISSQSDGKTKVISLPYFRYPKGENFIVEISREDVKIYERFFV
jgi:predicted XRE-type DNA-binding protein